MNPDLDILTQSQRQEKMTLQLLSRLRNGETRVAEQMFQQNPEISEDQEMAVELLFREFTFCIQENDNFDVEAWLNNYPKYRNRLSRLYHLYETFGDDTLGEAAELNDEATKPSVPGDHVIQSDTQIESLQPGAMIGQYRIMEQISQGGMGTVYRAHQISLDRAVALKIVRKSAFREDQLLRFQAEAEMAASFSHPNIVQVYEVGQFDKFAFISMELVDGGDLAERTRNRPMEPRRAAGLLQELASAVHAAHQHGIIHRDLKPGNVLLANQSDLDQPKIADFGLAKRVNNQNEDAIKSGVWVGTPAFMPPEQASGTGKPLSTSVDIYGLGGILYQCLTGSPPFDGDSIQSTLEKVVNKKVVAPRQLNRSIPRDLEEICLKCLNKEPSDRYETSQQLAQDLQHFLDHRTTLARPATPWVRLQKLIIRQPLMVTFATIMALVCLAAIIGIVANRNHAIEQAKIANQHRLEAERDFALAKKAIEQLAALSGELKEFSWNGQVAAQVISESGDVLQ